LTISSFQRFSVSAFEPSVIRAQQAVRPEKFAPETPVRQFVQVNVVGAPDKLTAPPPDNLANDAPDNPA